MVMLAILRLGSGASGPGVRRELDRRARRKISRGALYQTFGRLKAKGYVRWTLSSATGEVREGHPLRRFEVGRAGVEALRKSRVSLLNMWEGLEGILEKR